MKKEEEEGVFTLAIKFDCLFSGIFSKFSLICEKIFIDFPCFKIFIDFPCSAFWLTGQWGGGYIPRLPHGYVTAGTASHYGKSGPD